MIYLFMFFRSLFRFHPGISGRFLIAVLILFSPGIILYGSIDDVKSSFNINQGPVVSGTITDAETGDPIPGVNIIEKGTNNGTISDTEGKYRIELTEEDATLVYSFIGYLKQLIKYDGQSEINVELKVDAQSLDEVVVIGYGTQRAEDLTGSISVVSVEDMQQTKFPTIEKALQGRASGVYVSQTSGHPGSGVSVKIRGIGSINRSSEPLYIVDDVPTGGLNGIAPEDIESVQILKDASATAIFGARGANGVVIITTKRGRKNSGVKADFSAYTKTSDFPQYRRYDIMNADEYVSLTREAYSLTDPGNAPPIIASDSLRMAYGDVDTRWQDELLRTGFGQNYHAGLSGGNENSNFNVSGSYYSEDGVMINTNFERLNLRANSDFSILNDHLKIGESFLITQTKSHGSQGGQGNKWVQATLISPLMPVYEPLNLGGYAGPTDSINARNEQTNPIAEQMLRNQDSKDLRIITNLYGELEFLKVFKYKLNLGLIYGSGRSTTWIPEYELGDIGNRSNSVSELRENSRDYNQFLIENLLSYNQEFEEHDITFLAGHVFQRDYSNSFSAIGQEFRDPDHNTLAQAEIASSLGSYIGEHIIDSYLARLIYDYKGKYLFTSSIRRDGSSRFGPEGQRYGWFPSFSLGWKLNEDFLRDIEEINILKLRFSWGHTGNMNIGDYVYETYLLRPNASRYLFGMDETVYLGATDLRSTGNPMIQWEHSIMTNIGLDLSAFDNRLEFNAEYYIKNQDKMLTTIELPLVHGKDFDDPNSNPWYNLGDVQNKGFEFSVLHRNTFGPFTYSIGGNLTLINNKVVSLPNSVPIFTDFTITKEDHSIGSFYGYVADGILQSQEEVDNHAEQDAVPGDIRFRDLNNDGIISSLDRTIIGKPLPDYTYGINLELTYRGFDFALFLNGMQNLDVYNEHYSYIGLATDRESKDFNKLRSVMDYWTPEKNTNTQTRLSVKDVNYNARHSTWFVEDASFLRIHSMQLGYTVPSKLINKWGVENLRVYLNAQNLHVFTDYRGYDPEVGSSNVLSMGIDQGQYPIPRSFIFGIQLGL